MTSTKTPETAECRHCGKALKGTPYHRGGRAYDPATGSEAPACFYGGYVCSEQCDRAACLALESSFPGAGRATRLSCYAEQHVKSNWPEAA